jgi:hypothetical protein
VTHVPGNKKSENTILILHGFYVNWKFSQGLGRERWTVRLLAEKMIELKMVETVSPMTVCNTLKKNELKPHLGKYWKIPLDQNASFVAAMEDVLDVYARSHNEDYPVVCMDESSMQLIGEVSDPIPASQGHPELVDDEYVRKGVASIFLEVEALGGQRHVKITEHRTRIDWAHFAKMIRGHQELILNYFRAKKEFSSGVVEGLNNKAKLTTRKSYGFRSDKLREIALCHILGNIPVPEITHRFV